MHLVDTHAHLYWDSFKEDFDEVIKRALDAGVATIFNVGVDVEKSQVALDQIENQLSQFPELTTYSTIGIHPHEAFKYNDDHRLIADLHRLEEIYHSNPSKVIAVGEVGLDYFFQNNPDHFNPDNLSEEDLKDLQRKLLQTQIDLAKKLDLPLIIHCRDDRSENPENDAAWNEVIEMTKDWKGIYHCYSGLQATTHNLPPDFLVSFAANITYPKNEYLREAAQFLPLEKICLETDSPFLAPQSKRGQRNEPESVKEIAELIAQIKGINVEEVGKITTQNVLELFHLQK